MGEGRGGGGGGRGGPVLPPLDGSINSATNPC
jgi:hypothetical protein